MRILNPDSSKKRNVSFAPMVRICKTFHHNDMTPEDRGKVFYSRDELKQIKGNYRKDRKLGQIHAERNQKTDQAEQFNRYNAKCKNRKNYREQLLNEQLICRTDITFEPSEKIFKLSGERAKKAYESAKKLHEELEEDSNFAHIQEGVKALLSDE